MRLTKKEYEELLAKHPRLRRCAEPQKRKDANPGAADNRSQKATMDGEVHPKFRVSVAFLLSDNRRRDADNMLSTVLDCLIIARRRLLEIYPGDKDNLQESEEG